MTAFVLCQLKYFHPAYDTCVLNNPLESVKCEINKPIKDGGSTAGLPPCNKPKDQQSN